LTEKGANKDSSIKLQKEGGLPVPPSDKKPREVFIIFDGADIIWASKLWAKIQRPYIGRNMEEGPTMIYTSFSDRR
jgi:hypothetical protein